MTQEDKPRAWADIMSHCVANMGEEAFNDVLTEPYHPLAGVWCALDVDIRAKAANLMKEALRPIQVLIDEGWKLPLPPL